MYHKVFGPSKLSLEVTNLGKLTSVIFIKYGIITVKIEQNTAV